MSKLSILFLCVFIVGDLDGSLAGLFLNPENRYRQSIQTALEPMDGYIRKTAAQLNRIEGEQKAMQNNLQAVRNGQELQVTKIHTMMHDHLNLTGELLNQIIAQQDESTRSLCITKEDFETSLKKLQTKVEVEILAVQTSIEKLLTKIEGQYFQTTTLKPLSTTSSENIHSKFQLIGDRYFYIERNIKATWTSAESHCLRMGGYLATINESEFNPIRKVLERMSYASYWLGIHSKNNTDQFVSLATGKTPSFLEGLRKHFQPESCVFLTSTLLTNGNCNLERLFICQQDNQV
ncbi:accessory gland protein Acp29AB-like [Drosophila takahashii]|uniref:accessory gland protein Acp29AB-like n=1 Tax=Drosophila takahashii TaxID=29030 RepID=UPI001CF8D413|nr:accessory gland protein Acp29AB-like [Drosophila takahashii]